MVRGEVADLFFKYSGMYPNVPGISYQPGPGVSLKTDFRDFVVKSAIDFGGSFLFPLPIFFST